ncbi:condensation domain-containing protein, partial [Rothia sp. AR01]
PPPPAEGTAAGAARTSTGLREWAARHPRTGADAPATSGQSRLWFLHRLDPASAEYNVVLRIALSGSLDAGALAGAVGDLVERHEILRTVFPDAGGRPVQRVVPAPPDLLGSEPLDAGAGFDLTAQIPFRAALVPTGPEAWRLELVLHHIATDGASLAPLTRDLAAAYSARVSARRGCSGACRCSSPTSPGARRRSATPRPAPRTPRTRP